ncbi:hypothetical protein [Actinomadura sp. K4S16]|uniref:hypothetical protein n=1 Tax=Actinomadura sp. K4S16 TaxID=1316147 RepID=UPI0011EDE406|nr:hypothetical protein [Actinomadura sp. K4S16]
MSAAFQEYDIVRVKEGAPGRVGDFAGRNAVVVGISERGDPPYYVLKIDGYQRTVACEEADIEATGRRADPWDAH